MNKAVYFFCMNKNTDPVASSVFNYICNNGSLAEKDIVIDGFPVMEKNNGNIFQFVRLNDVLSHDYTKYLPLLNNYFGDFNAAGVVNWHEGASSPDKILTVHSTGDVPSGIFGNSNPQYLKNLISSLEENRIKYQLNDFSVMIEGTHWSGIPYKQPPALIREYSVPVYDIEIGSTIESWNNKTAVKILSESLLDIFSNDDQTKTLLCVGGIHFEKAYSDIMLKRENKISIGHILPNQWVVGNYSGKDGREKLNNCLRSIAGGINGILFHDNLKGEYKELCRECAEKNNVYSGKHKILRTPEEIQLWK